MKTTLRFSLTMLLCFIVCLFVAPAAFATTIVDSGTCGAQGDNLTWTLDDEGTLTISGTGAMKDYPTWYLIQPWRDYKNSIIELVVNDGVTALGWGAFCGMTNLQRVVLPEGITSLPDQVFCNCKSLSDINFPSSLTTLNYECLFDTGIDTLFLPKTVTTVEGPFYGGLRGAESKQIETAPNHPVFSAVDGVLFTKDLSTLVMYPCCDQTTYTVPDGTIEIREHAFAFNDTLETLRIPATVAFIGEGAFYHCTGLKTAGPSDGDYNIKFGWTDSVPDYAFFDCTGLKSITIPNSVTSIGNQAFSGCTGLTNITIPNSVTSIGDYAFYNCESLTSITIPNSVTTIELCVFCDCTGLTSITIPSSVTSIGDCAFENCSGLTSITIPNSVTSIGDSAFENCTDLTSITIPNNVTSIEYDAFYNCESLTSITIPNSVTSIGNQAFSGCTGLTSITIPNSVTSIGEYAFSFCDSLTSITIPNSVTSIGHGVFRCCKSLASIIIPNSVTSIDSLAFDGCTGLTSITIPNSVTSIGGKTLNSYVSAFEGCTGLKTAGPLDGYYNYKFGWTDSVPDYAFFDCTGLMSITIPNSVTSIGDSAFENCTDLTDVYYSGTQEQWNQISFGDYNDDLISATIHFIPAP